MAQKIQALVANKIKSKELEFKQRFPRDHRYARQQMLSFLPQALSLKQPLELIEEEQKVAEIFQSVDENKNQALDPWEMHDWMLYVESHVQKSRLDKQWHDLAQAEDDELSWPDFVFKVWKKSGAEGREQSLWIFFCTALLLDFVESYFLNVLAFGKKQRWRKKGCFITLIAKSAAAGTKQDWKCFQKYVK